MTGMTVLLLVRPMSAIVTGLHRVMSAVTSSQLVDRGCVAGASRHSPICCRSFASGRKGGHMRPMARKRGMPFPPRRHPGCSLRALTTGSDRVISNSNREAGIIIRRDLVAFLPVGSDAADIGHEDAGLAGDVRAHVPGVGARIERGVADLVDMLDPGFLRLRGCFYSLAAVFPQIGDAVDDPVDVLLDRHDHVAEDRGAARAGDRE